MKNPLVTVIGGTGFVGRQVVSALLRNGFDVQVLSRRAQECRSLFPAAAGGGRLILRNADVTQPKTLHDRLEGSYAVVNLVGVLFEKGRQRFFTLHSQCAERLAVLARESGVQRFIHLSALGVNEAKGSRYASSKATGETAVHEAFPAATILRPSVIFGAEDNFINQFRRMAQRSPALPLIGGGNTLFQPVFVGDVAQAVVACLKRDDTMGITFELGGPQVLSFREILQRILRSSGLKRPLISLPFSLAGMIGLFAELLPSPPLTRDQVTLLKYDNVVRSENTLATLGISPRPLSLLLPEERSAPQAIIDAEADQITAQPVKEAA